MTFCFVDIIPNNRKVVLTFFLHSSELQNSTKLLKPLAEVTVNWLATCVLCLLFFPTKHHENHKRLMNRSALKSFGEWCFQKPPSFDGTFIHKNLQLLCLHVSICSISSKSLSKLHKGPAQGEAGRRFRRTLGALHHEKCPKNFPHNLIFSQGREVELFSANCYWKPLDSKPCLFSGKGFMLKKMIARILDLVSQVHPIGKTKRSLAPLP